MRHSKPTRRTVLTGMAAAAGTLTLNRLGAFAQPRTVPGPAKTDELISGMGKVNGQLVPFPMTDVRLTDSIFKQQAEYNQQYLASLSTDRLLHSFRLTSGITSTVVPYGGWEKPDCELRGHFNGGHFLSAVALAYASSGNDDLRKAGNTMVSEMVRCQKANNNGYLSAFPEAEFETLARGKSVWAPFYTLHKIMAGMVDMYIHTGNEDALQAAEDLAGWVSAYFQAISDDQRMFMLRTEYGGMNEVLANLASITGRQRYLQTAHLFEQPMFLDPLAQHRDALTGIHANTHVPKVIGAARMYELTGESRYRDIAQYFLDEVLTERLYPIGNTSVGEFWRTDAGNLKGTLQFRDAECCVAYNLMKLDRHLFSWTGDARYMDAYERSLWNARMGTQNQQGLKQYFFPLAAGYWRYYNSPDNSFWCCTGTGAEEFAKFNDTIYFKGPGDTQHAAVWINQFIPSELTWKEAGFGLRQQTDFPAEQGTTLVIKTATPQRRTIHVRVPGWVDGGSVKINGRDLEAFAQPGSYLALTREWRDGDKIEVALPMKLTTEPLPGDPTLRAAVYGPLLLAADLGAGPAAGPLRIGTGDTAPRDPGPAAPNPVAPEGDAAAFIDITSAKDLTFRSNTKQALSVMPMYRITDQKYAVYWATGQPG